MNKKVLVVGYGELREFIYSTLIESGQIDLYLITNDSEIVNQQYFKEVYVVDTNDFVSVSAFVSSLEIEFDFIVTFREPFVLLASYLQNCFCKVKSSLAGVLRSSANKYLMRKTLEGKEYSVKTVSVNLESLDLFKESLIPIKFPCVVKPKSGYRSLGVYKINNNLEVLDVYDKVINDINTGNLALSSEYQAEEFIGGEMYSADGFVLNGEFSQILLTKQLLGLEPYFILETTLAGFKDWEDLRDNFKDEILDVVKSLGFENTLFHMEFKIENGKFYLIEIASRSAGGPILGGYFKALGVNLPLAFVSQVLGLEYSFKPETRNTYIMHAEYAHKNFDYKGLMRDLDFECVDFIELAHMEQKIIGYPSKPSVLYVCNFFSDNQILDASFDLDKMRNSIKFN